MPSASIVRPCSRAEAETTLSRRSSSTWSGVIGGFGRDCRIRRLHLHQRERHRHQQPAAFGGGEDILHQLFERTHIRTAEFVDRTGLAFAVDGSAIASATSPANIG